jgi:hypothetical protein
VGELVERVGSLQRYQDVVQGLVSLREDAKAAGKVVAEGERMEVVGWEGASWLVRLAPRKGSQELGVTQSAEVEAQLSEA